MGAPQETDGTAWDGHTKSIPKLGKTLASVHMQRVSDRC